MTTTFDTIQEVTIPLAEDEILTRQGQRASIQKFKGFFYPYLSALGLSDLRDYEEGLIFTTDKEGVLYNGRLYIPLTNVLPYTTTEVFDTTKWKVVSINTKDTTSVDLYGPLEVVVDSTVQWTITNYNSFSTYGVEVPDGFIGSVLNGVVSVDIPAGYEGDDFSLIVYRDGSANSFLVEVGTIT